MAAKFLFRRKKKTEKRSLRALLESNIAEKELGNSLNVETEKPVAKKDFPSLLVANDVAKMLKFREFMN